MIPNYTLVVGVDQKHLLQLAMVWPTWRRFKPSLLEHPMLVFYDDSVVESQVRHVVDHPNLEVVSWPQSGVVFKGTGERKWGDSQRYKMLAGFTYVPARFVRTPFWLKLDTDVVATGQDKWIDPGWFDGFPTIVSHPWSFTKPADQMQVLDEWVQRSQDKLPELSRHHPLDLIPIPGNERLGHKRIISWCAFFDTAFTSLCSVMAEKTCGQGQLPVRSQDGFAFYCAKRLGLGIVRPNMKKYGWEHWSTDQNVRRAVERVMTNV